MNKKIFIFTLIVIFLFSSLPLSTSLKLDSSENDNSVEIESNQETNGEKNYFIRFFSMAKITNSLGDIDQESFKIFIYPGFLYNSIVGGCRFVLLHIKTIENPINISFSNLIYNEETLYSGYELRLIVINSRPTFIPGDGPDGITKNFYHGAIVFGWYR